MSRVVLLLLAAAATCARAATNYDYQHLNVTPHGSGYLVIDRDGREIYMPEDLMKKLQEELETWHWKPWLRTRTKIEDNVVHEVAACAFSDSSSFPDSIFTEDQLRNGAFLLYVLFGIYAFTLLAVVCNDYFIPCVELICEDLKIPQNVAAATFMAVATSCPEFFVNTISTFITESDMGIGTIVGSALFNALGVAAIGSLAAIRPIPIEMRPVTRDVVIYMINVGVLVAIVWDGQVDWYEAMVLGILYIVYFIFMFNSVRLFALYDRLVGNCCNKNSDMGLVEIPVNGNAKSVEEGVDNKAFEDVEEIKRNSMVNGGANGVANGVANGHNNNNVEISDTAMDPPKKKRGIFSFPSDKSVTYKCWWVYTWPLRIIMSITIPSTVTCRRFYPMAFIMCIIWIGINSYFVSWSMTVIGNTFFIPDSVMGMTFLAFGGCLPEACSIYIMSRRGEGGIGVSNALGANSLAILFALGVPWLIRTLTLMAQGAEQTAVLINSDGIDFVVGSLLVAVICLWLVLYFSKFVLRKGIGFILFFLYAIFITFAILVELGVILRGTMEIC